MTPPEKTETPVCDDVVDNAHNVALYLTCKDKKWTHGTDVIPYETGQRLERELAQWREVAGMLNYAAKFIATTECGCNRVTIAHAASQAIAAYDALSKSLSQ